MRLDVATTVVASVVLAALGLAPPALAQQSANFKLTEWTINAGGDPVNGNSAASASWKVRLDAIGDGVLGVGQASASVHLDSGFVDVYAPPGEVQNQRFTNASTMSWDPEKSIGVYEAYRGLISTLPGGFGSCYQSSLAGTTASDAGNPPLGDAWFYLVTAKNRIGEEGTKGNQTGGAARGNPSPCP